MFVRSLDICNYADDSALYLSDNDATNMLSKLESALSTFASWFKDQCIRSNDGKYHFMVFGDQSNYFTIQIETTQTTESREKELSEIVR